MIRFRPLLLAVAAAGLAAATFAPAFAQLRGIPTDAKRGNLAPLNPPQPTAVELDGKRIELSAGSQIRDGRNMIILPNALPQATMQVKYQLGLDGKLHRVWLLTPQEAAQPDPK
jgi:hypothetical protein